MVKQISLFLYKIIFYLDKLLYSLFKRSILIWFKDFLHQDSYKFMKISNQKVQFFVPNSLVNWRVETFYSKEPETLKWIDSFNKNQKFIFWDIGSNIGLYSIYNAIKNQNSKTISFEPSTSNLRVLSRNISLNNLQNKIEIMPLALTNQNNIFLNMNEKNFVEGGALNSFGETYNFEGKQFEAEMKYKTFGTSIDYIIEKNILEIPDYIKVDVDGIEHLILKSGERVLKDKKLKSMLIEINENFVEQYNDILNIMKDSGFEIKEKKIILTYLIQMKKIVLVKFIISSLKEKIK
jgi:FkbM family methyltransferase